MIDEKGFRHGVAMVIVDERNRIFWARRCRNHGWQFPQGGLEDGEKPIDAMYRELYEETGLKASDIEILSESKRWFYYYLPKNLVRTNVEPLCIGQRQKWYLIRVNSRNIRFRFDVCAKPEFEGFRWVNYWYPLKQVVFFKRRIYKRALKEFASILFRDKVLIKDDQAE